VRGISSQCLALPNHPELFREDFFAVLSYALRGSAAHCIPDQPHSRHRGNSFMSDPAIQQDSELVRLPLWKACVDNMRKDGVNHGKTYPADYFEQQLRTTRETMQFSLGLSEIRRELERDGFYLSGRGQHGNQFVILPPENNRDVMASYQRQAFDALKRGVILGTNTRLDLLPSEDRKKHESLLEKMAIRTALMQRTGSVVRVLKKHSPAWQIAAE
jgi:hypothetical protein